MGAASLGCNGKILFLPNLFGIFCCCFLFVEIFSPISNFFLCHNPDTPLHFAISGHVPFFVTIVTFYQWVLCLVPVDVHHIGIMWWSLLVLLLLLPIQLQWVPESLSQQGQQWWWWSWHLLCGGFPQRTLIHFVVKGFFSLGNSPLMICPDCLIIPLLDCNQARLQLSEMSPKSLIQGSFEFND